MAVKNFSVTPSVSISRSKFKRDSQHKTSIKLGDITPIYLDEVLPGDTRKIDMAALVRMNTPVAPIMDNIYIDYYAFFCPNRLLWTHWKEFMGENNTSAGIYTGTEYVMPTSDIADGSTNSGACSSGSLGDHLGLPFVAGSSPCLVSSLPGRMYFVIYNEWFRDQNLIAPIAISLGDASDDSFGPNQGGYGEVLLKAAKTSDYFTRSLPYAQKGAPVQLPFSDRAPVRMVAGNGTMDRTNFVNVASSSGAGGTPTHIKLAVRQTGLIGTNATIDSGGTVSVANSSSGGVSAGGDLYADLATATAVTINQLRFAFQYQKMLEKDALYGTRYWEILNAHFGVQAPDSSLQRPELLGHFRQNINIDQVIQTTGINQSTPASNTLGQTAAVSVTGGKGNLVTKSFTEHGYIMILAVARHDQTYGQGVSRDWTRLHRTDYYFPVFANLGAQSVKNKEIFAQGTSADDLEFGYQEAWAEYRYKPSIVSGELRPNVTGLGYWTLANNFASLPTLSQSFIEQDRSNLARAIGSFDQDFICDFYFKDIAVRPMPLYSVPGLIDHH